MESISFQTAADVSLHVRISRPATSTTKPLVVFFHYWGGTSSTWHKLISTDSSTSLQAIFPIAAIDCRGWGKSVGPSQENGHAYSIAAMASDTASLLQQLQADQEKQDLFAHGFIFAAHSMGAKVALATLNLLSADLRPQLKGLVLVAPAPPSALELPADMKAQQQGAYETEESIRWTVQNILANSDKLTDEDMDILVRDGFHGHPLAKRAWPSYGMQEDVSREFVNALASWTQTPIRASVLVGELDIVEPKERVDALVGLLAENGVRVSLTTVKDVKHLIPLEDPEIIFQEISKF